MIFKIKKSLITFLAVISAAIPVAACALAFTSATKAYAYTTDDLSGTNTISQIYDESTGKFNKNNLDALAQKVGYTGIDDMVTKVSALSTTSTDGVKTSDDFGDTVVDFGKDARNNNDLTWIPSFVSNTAEGPILTLWLASGSDTSYFNPEYNEHADTNPSSNNYSTSYIRVAALNNGGTHYTGYGNTDSKKILTAQTAPATSDNSNKFEMFTTGALKDYIVTPNDVSWQKTANKSKNDPEWAGDTSGQYPDKDAWLSDKLWLPSLYEVYDSTLADNSTTTLFTEDGGLWKTGDSLNRQKRSNSVFSWLRSGHPTNYSSAYNLLHFGVTDWGTVKGTNAVRPALHLNLKAAAAAAETTVNNIYWGISEHKLIISDSEVTNAANNGSFNYNESFFMDVPWYSVRNSITAVEIVGTPAPTSMTSWFYDLSNCSSINLSGLDTSSVTQMDYMFSSCNSLKTLDLSSLDTSNVTNVYSMFADCKNLETLDLSYCDMSKTISAVTMFRNCNNLKEIKTPTAIGSTALPLPCNFWNGTADITEIASANVNTTIYRHEAHSGGAATCTAKAVCSVCEKEYGELSKHSFNANGTCTRCNEQAVASVAMDGNVVAYFSTLDEALKFAAESDVSSTVTMLADVQTGETLKVKGNITLDLNGHGITFTGEAGSVIEVDGNNTKFTLTGDGEISGGKGSGAENKLGGGVFVDGGGKFNMTGGKICGNTADYGGGVRINDGCEFVMTGGEISGNTAAKDGGGLCVCRAERVELSGGKIYGNTAAAGGAIYFEGEGKTYTIGGTHVGGEKNGDTVTDENKAVFAAGVVYSGNGGAIYVDGTTVIMESGSISYNSAEGNGGGVYVTNGGAFEISEGEIVGNSASFGGGVFVGDGTINMTDGEIVGNSASFGGGIAVYSQSNEKTASAEISGGKIYKNVTGESGNGGAGIYVHDASVTVGGNTEIYENESATYGGGIRSYNGNVSVSGAAIIKDNKANIAGGIYLNNYGKLSLDGTARIENNKTSYFSSNASSDMCGVCASDGVEVSVGGAVKVWNNINTKNTDDESDDLQFDMYCKTNSSYMLKITGSLSQGEEKAKIGLLLTVLVITDGYEDENTADPNYIFKFNLASHRNAWCAGIENGEAKALAHDWDTDNPSQYDAEHHTVPCKRADCNISGLVAHSYGQDVTGESNLKTAATCTEKAVYYEVCACGKLGTGTFEGGEPLGHNLTQHEAKAATCTEVGWNVYEACSRCDYTTYAEIAAQGHDFASEFTVDKQPSCTENGSKSKHCARCDEKTEVTEIAILAHTEESIPAVAATCAQTGLTEGKKCSVCGTVTVAQGTVAKLAHMEENIPAVAATCAQTGLTEGKKCSVCGTVTVAQETVAKLAHTEEIIPAVAATCAQTGLTEGKKCSVCGTVTVEQETVAKLAHTEESIPAVAATCTQTGLTEGKKCSVCGTVTVAQETVAKLAHTEENIPAVAATCTQTGLTEGKQCSVCGTVTVEQQTVAALGHDLGEWFTVRAATLDEFGEERRVCSHDITHYESRQLPKRVPQLSKPDKDGAADGVIVSQPDGLAPELELVVTEIASENYPEYSAVADSADGVIECVYDVTLKTDGVAVQPDGTLTVKLRVPENLRGKEFKLFHLHGGEATDKQYTLEGNYAVVDTDRLSEFIFVGEKAATVNPEPVTPAPEAPAAGDESKSYAWISLLLIPLAIAAGGVVLAIYDKRKNL